MQSIGLWPRAWAVVIAVAATGLLDAEVAEAATFRWIGAEGCPAESVVRSRLESDLKRPLEELPSLTFEARAQRKARGYTLLLHARKGESIHERHIDAESCDELVNVLVAAMSLAIESLAPEPEPADERGEPSGAASSVDQAEQGGIPAAAEPAQVQATGPSPRSSASAEPSQAATSWEFGSFGAAGAIMDIGALPEPAFGPEASFGITLAGWRLGLLGALIPRHRSSLEGHTEGDFDLMFGGLAAGWMSSSGPLRVGGQLRAEVGQFRGEGVSVSAARQRSVLWFAAVPEIRIIAGPPRSVWGGVMSAGLVFPLYRRPFGLTEFGAVHEPALPGLRVGLGLEAAIR